MPKALLALTLLLAQSLSWQGAPLYLCLEHDGEFCVDSGPHTCHCNHDGHSHEAEEPTSASATADCDCVHLLLLGNQATVVVSRPVTHDTLGLDLTVLSSSDLLPIVEVGSDPTSSIVAPSDSFSALTERASVVMRC